MASIFAIALLLLANSRPYEGFAFALPLIVYFAYKLDTRAVCATNRHSPPPQGRSS